MSFETWDEIRTAYQVARLGTVSGAADVLGVHHATVIRHIDALEGRLGSKLFQRHARGYTPTDAGRELLEVAQGASDRFDQLAARIKGQSETVSGELIITAISGIPRLLAPSIASFQKEHPGLHIRFLTDMRLFRLNSGEAHVAIRAGARPEDPDYVVQKFIQLRNGMYAAKCYADRHGLPKTEAELSRHWFVGPDDPQARAPFYQWLRGAVPAERVVFRTSEAAATEAAVRAGAGIGFMTLREAARDPDLIEVMAPRPEWTSPLWLVTHVDLHRTLKVQKFLAHIKKASEGWTDI
ncbi:LysR family transcriptional regulator [Frigidibacter sp. RF13]|uniref:LysR family transcriptional regulator n=1 Tax=Frigidibacter sp. RF13 TaxID=2997340 RepID=UPI00226D93FB|nr:LysR family transcriptional regulator [Frigidibacter sp. RF13]MCY1128044.1 LysR family transcriptional regulator [Frigidibacter sp. RF13]